MIDFPRPDGVPHDAHGSVACTAPSNIALVKYWGKHGRQLPSNPSISLTLSAAHTRTRIDYRAGGTAGLTFFFHGERTDAFADRIERYLRSIHDITPFVRELDLEIHSENTFPHSTGIASSASAMAALAHGLCRIEHDLFGTLADRDLFRRKASYLARLASGSACRSIYPTAAVWGAWNGLSAASDEVAIPMEDRIHPVFRSYRDTILIVSGSEKSVSSSAGHGLMTDNPYAPVRFDQARTHMTRILDAMAAGDLEAMGRIIEAEALTLHALMMTSTPSYVLMHPNTLAMIDRIRAFRRATDLPVYFTLDAGPNIHLLYPASAEPDVRPFMEDQLLPLCEDGRSLDDRVGHGATDTTDA